MAQATCKYCEKEFEYRHYNNKRTVCDLCKKAIGNLRQIKYSQSEKGQKYYGKWQNENKEYHKKYYRKWSNKIKVYQKKYRQTGKGKASERKHNQRKTKTLTTCYIKQLLQMTGLGKENITPELIRLKRIQMKFFRELKKGKEILNELLGNV